MAAYQEEGLHIAAEIGNRGPIRLTDDGRLHPDILAAHWRQGFYVFEGLIDGDELAELRRDANEMLERAPVGPDADVDARGRPALGLDYARRPYLFAKPLADPWGGTGLLGGRHPTQMTQPLPEQDAPTDVVFLMSSMCRAMPSGLRLYGHPQLLEIAAAINGDDYVPFNDAIFVKQPGLGGSVSWHQDGVTHWGSPDWDEGIHGFNFQVQLYPTTPASCLWVAPGTHKLGKIDIKARVRANEGSEQLPGPCRSSATPATSPSSTARCSTPRLPTPRPTCGSRLPSAFTAAGRWRGRRPRSASKPTRSSTTPNASSNARR